MPRSGFEEGVVGSPQRSTESLDSCFFLFDLESRDSFVLLCGASLMLLPSIRCSSPVLLPSTLCFLPLSSIDGLV